MEKYRQEAERLEPLVFGHEAVMSLEVTRDHANMELACVAENELSQIPVSSNHRTLGVKCEREIERLFTCLHDFLLKVGPSHVYIQGPEEIEHHEGEGAEFSCFSDESNPPSDIAVIVRGIGSFVSIKTSSHHQPHYRSVWQRGRHGIGSIAHHEDLCRILNSNELQIPSSERC